MHHTYLVNCDKESERKERERQMQLRLQEKTEKQRKKQEQKVCCFSLSGDLQHYFRGVLGKKRDRKTKIERDENGRKKAEVKGKGRERD